MFSSTEVVGNYTNEASLLYLSEFGNDENRNDQVNLGNYRVYLGNYRVYLRNDRTLLPKSSNLLI